MSLTREEKHEPAPDQRVASRARWQVAAAAAVIILAGVVAYHNSFDAPFVFDDIQAIVKNESIRRLWQLGDVLLPHRHGGYTASGRPLVNLSLAINRALGGEKVWGYHAFNLSIHLLAGLALFGIVRRTLQRANCGSLPAGDQPSSATGTRPPNDALILAFFTALLWTVHPLLTESVTYVVQRAESLMGLCYLLTLYCFIRGVDAQQANCVAPTGEASAGCRSGFTPRFDERGDVPSRHKAAPTRSDRLPKVGSEWLVASFSVCLLGMATKEVMASAPLMVFLYDRTFVSGTFPEVWRRRKRFYGALAATWILLACLMAGTGSRGGTVGFGAGVSPWVYALTQCRALVQYLRLSAWPHPLVFDYGEATAKNLGEVWSQALLVIALLTGTVVALWRRPAWGFVGAWFFVILAPSSSFVPLPHQTLAEHRMYLSLAAPVVLAVAALYAALGRHSWGVFAVMAAGWGWLTIQRNEVYRSEESLWSDTVAKRPDNGRAHVYLAVVHENRGRFAEAVAHYEPGLRLDAYYAKNGSAQNNYGKALMELGRLTEAVPHLEQAARLKPDLAEAHANLGLALSNLGRIPEAIPPLEEAVRLKLDFADAQLNLGYALAKSGRAAEAIAHFEQALRIKPAFPEAQLNLGVTLAGIGRFDEAIVHFEQAVRLRPTYAAPEFNWALALMDSSRFEEAFRHFQSAIALDPASTDFHGTYGRALAEAGRHQEAVAEYSTALRLNPNQAAVHLNLAVALRLLGRTDEAGQHHREALRLDPNLPGEK